MESAGCRLSQVKQMERCDECFKRVFLCAFMSFGGAAFFICCNMNRSVVSCCLQRHGPVQVPGARHEKGTPRSEHVRDGRILGAGGDSTRECCHTRTGLHSR